MTPSLPEHYRPHRAPHRAIALAAVIFVFWSQATAVVAIVIASILPVVLGLI
jgi:hypothetical protein